MNSYKNQFAKRLTLVTAILTLILGVSCAQRQKAVPQNSARPVTPQAALEAMRRASHYFRTKVATHGGYLWHYTADLRQREGEGKATRSMIWVQSPGTPAVGTAYLNAYAATGDTYYLDAAIKAAYALIEGQLESGGWAYYIEFDSKRRKSFAYRTELHRHRAFNVTNLDDDNTQGAVRFLMQVDKVLHFEDGIIHEAVQYALSALLKAQYPNGAWPQRFAAFPSPQDFPIKKANYPPSWSRTYPNQDYTGFYTLNDNAIDDVIETMLEAYHTYGNKDYLKAAEKGGDFLILAQMPSPQPGWAQQYNRNMQPDWARRFEPPAITGGESQGVMETLLVLYRETGNKKYLAPIPRALAYYRKSLLPDGQLARFYALKTNRPIYFTKQDELVYQDGKDMLLYNLKVPSRLDSIAQEYQQLKAARPSQLKNQVVEAQAPSPAELKKETAKVIAALDNKGRWLSTGRLRYVPNASRPIIETRTFIKNMNILSAYLRNTQQP